MESTKKPLYDIFLVLLSITQGIVVSNYINRFVEHFLSTDSLKWDLKMGLFFCSFIAIIRIFHSFLLAIIEYRDEYVKLLHYLALIIICICESILISSIFRNNFNASFVVIIILSSVFFLLSWHALMIYEKADSENKESYRKEKFLQGSNQLICLVILILSILCLIFWKTKTRVVSSFVISISVLIIINLIFSTISTLKKVKTKHNNM